MDVSDIVEINQLLAHYGHIVDAADWDRFDELFLPDAELDYTPVNAPAVFHGIGEIQDYFRGANHPSAHHCVNVYVYAEGDSVRVKSKFFAPYTRDSHTPKRWYGGDYDDVVVRTDEGWRFARRVCSARWQFTPDSEAAEPRRRTF